MEKLQWLSISSWSTPIRIKLLASKWANDADFKYPLWKATLIIFLRTLIHFFKVGLSPSKKKFFICFYDSSSKVMKNAFYFILKLFSFSRYLNFCFDFSGM